jgi:hypothetical protein
MKFIRGTGVPCGTRWEIADFVFFVQLNRIVAVHADMANVRFKVRVDVTVNVCGRSANPFTIRMNMKMEEIIFSVPGFMFGMLFFISFLKNFVIVFFITDDLALTFFILLVSRIIGVSSMRYDVFSIL